MAVALDLLTRVRNIHWAGGDGVFVSGGGAQRQIKIKKSHSDEKKWTDLGPLDFSSAGTSQASSYAKLADETTVFLLGGEDGGGETGETTDNGLIMASADGLTWSKVHTVASGDDFVGAAVFGIVWDKIAQCFYAGAHIITSQPRDPDLGFLPDIDHDLLLQSFDGRGWSEIARESWEARPSDEETYKGLLAAHCSNKVKDSFGNGVPDGIYGFDEKKDILIAPTGVPRIIYTDGLVRSDPRSSVTIKTQSDTTIVEVGIMVNCVAYAGGVWMAAGTKLTDPSMPASAYSIDDGANWTKIDVVAEEEHPQEIVTICAAPKTDLEPASA